MTAKAQRNAKARKKRNQRRSPSAADASDLVRPLRLVVDSLGRADRLRRLAGGDPAKATAIALAEVQAAAAEVADMAAPYDAFDVLEAVRMAQMPLNAETYKETEHEGMAAVIELVALILAGRGHRHGAAGTTEEGHRVRPDPVIDKIIATARTAMDVGSLIPFLDTITDPTGTGYRLGAVLREVFVRNLSYEHMEDDTLTGLFDAADIEADCRSIMGCIVAEIRAVFDAIVQLHTESWAKRFGTFEEFAAFARAEMAQARRLGPAYQISDEARTHGRQLFDDMWDDLGDNSTFTVDAVAAEAQLDKTVVEAVLDLFSLNLAVGSPAAAAEKFFAGESPLRRAPILRDPQTGDMVVAHHALLTSSVRDRVEAALRTNQTAWSRYDKHRARYLEDAAVALLEPHLPGWEIWRNYEYYLPDPKAMVPQETPAAYTRLVEGDALIVVDDVAIIVEGKAGGLDPRSRAGDGQRLYTDLRDIVTSAADQAERVRARIEHDQGLRLRSGDWLDLSTVREIYSIAVSLEDLSGIATVTSELVLDGLLPNEHLPWTVSLHDLRIISELVEQPAELLLYLRRRTEPDVTRKFHAVDELDLFLHFYGSGLYVEPDPDRVQAELPQLGEPGVAARRRFKSEPLTMLLSRTDDLDAWYFYTRGIRVTPAPKPKLNANEQLYAIVGALAAQREPGWLRIGATLLDASGVMQRKFMSSLEQVIDLTDQDGDPHTVAMLGGTRADNSFVLIWSSQGAAEPLAEARTRLSVYLTAKKHQSGVSLGVALLFDAGDPTTPTMSIYDPRRPGPDSQLDELVERVGLRPLERRFMRFPPPNKASKRKDRKGRR